MSMTWEAAIEWFESHMPTKIMPVAKAAYEMAIAALRFPTREMVERVFPGCKMCKPVCHKCKNYPLALYPQACKTCVEHSNFEAVSNFCEDCGRPMTDEAVDMMLERMEVMYEKG